MHFDSHKGWGRDEYLQPLLLPISLGLGICVKFHKHAILYSTKQGVYHFSTAVALVPMTFLVTEALLDSSTGALPDKHSSHHSRLTPFSELSLSAFS